MPGLVAASRGAVSFAATGQPLSIGLGAAIGAAVRTAVEWRRA